MGYRERDNNYQKSCHDEHRHVHELQGSVKLGDREDPHTHRFCTVTGEAIPHGAFDHFHEVVFRTDTYDDHHHEFKGKTGCAVMVGDRHVHYIEAITSLDDGHRHSFEAATMIENPTGFDKKKERYNKADDHRDEYNR